MKEIFLTEAELVIGALDLAISFRLVAEAIHLLRDHEPSMSCVA